MTMKEWFIENNQKLLNHLTTSWYQADQPPNAILKLLEKCYLFMLKTREIAYKKKWLKANKPSCLVIVVGNITMGGTGKTPMVIWLIQKLKEWGYKPGVVSRGYGGSYSTETKLVKENSNPTEVGDEPVLIAKHTKVPVVIGKNRYQAAESLFSHHQVNVIVSDDGLQHLGLARDIEIVMISGSRQYGNGHCLPAGPLREPTNRLSNVDFVIVKNGVESDQYILNLNANKIYSIKDIHQNSPTEVTIESFNNKKIHAIAGIGNPEDFFDSLSQLGINFIKHTVPDHHAYNLEDVDFIDKQPVITTEKDAIKLQQFNLPNVYYLATETTVSNNFQESFKQKIETMIKK